MWMSVSACRLMGLLTLTAVMLLYVSQVESYVPVVGLPCCRKVVTKPRLDRIKTCYEQTPREGCHRHAFLITTRNNVQWCVSPNATWLNMKLDEGKLTCEADVTPLNAAVEVDAE